MLAEPPSPWRRCETDDRKMLSRTCKIIFIGIKPPMHLVDDHHVDRRHLAPYQRLHRGDLHRPRPVRHFMICLDHADVADTLGVEFLHRLVDQRQRRHGEEGPAAIIAIAPGNGRTDDCLAKSRRRLSYEVTLAGGYCAIDLVEQLDLMRAKGIAAMGE